MQIDDFWPMRFAKGILKPLKNGIKYAWGNSYCLLVLRFLVKKDMLKTGVTELKDNVVWQGFGC